MPGKLISLIIIIIKNTNEDRKRSLNISGNLLPSIKSKKLKIELKIANTIQIIKISIVINQLRNSYIFSICDIFR
jgi:hypothetical protein